jgi:hypothetical protein
MENTRVDNELDAFEAIAEAKSDEQSFYALCRYFDFITDDYSLMRALKKEFRTKGNNLYLGAGESLFNIIENDTQTPRAAWSDVLGTITGGGNRLLLPFAKSGMSASVGRKIHSLLPLTNKVKNKIQVIIEEKGICLGRETDKRYIVDGRRKKLIWLLAESSKPIRMKSCAELLGLNLSEKNKISIDKKSVNSKFKSELGVANDLILRVSGGYSFNYDSFDITVRK